MKIRMRGATVRLRLTRSEIAQFASTGLVEETVTFPSAALRYRLIRSSTMAADFENGLITIAVTEAAANDWTGTEQVGIAARVNAMDILIEKDFQCAHGPADLDAFPPERPA